MMCEFHSQPCSLQGEVHWLIAFFFCARWGQEMKAFHNAALSTESCFSWKGTCSQADTKHMRLGFRDTQVTRRNFSHCTEHYNIKTVWPKQGNLKITLSSTNHKQVYNDLKGIVRLFCPHYLAVQRYHDPRQYNHIHTKALRLKPKRRDSVKIAGTRIGLQTQAHTSSGASMRLLRTSEHTRDGKWLIFLSYTKEPKSSLG